MRRSWTEEELVERWTLFSDELALIGAKTGHTRLGFAVMPRFFAGEGRFPRDKHEVPVEVLRFVGEQAGDGPEAGPKGWLRYDWGGGSIKYRRGDPRSGTRGEARRQRVPEAVLQRVRQGAEKALGVDPGGGFGRLARGGAGSKIALTNSCKHPREKSMAENGRLTGTFRVKSGMAQMLKGGVIMDVVDAGQARIAEEAGAVAVMALERVPADIRADGGVARMSDPETIVGIQEAVSIPVMAKARIGHFVEAQVLEALEVDYVDESEVLTPADEAYHIDKHAFTIPFVCGATNLGEALRRIGEGAAMIRSKGEAGTGNVVEAVRHMRAIVGGIRRLTTLGPEELMTEAKNLGAPHDLVRWVSESGRLPVVLFTAGGIATPADAALMMQLGADGVFVGSGIFKSGDPASRAAAIVKATTHFEDAKAVAEASRGLGEAMVGREMGELKEGERLAARGW